MISQRKLQIATVIKLLVYFIFFYKKTPRQTAWRLNTMLSLLLSYMTSQFSLLIFTSTCPHLNPVHHEDGLVPFIVHKLQAS